MTHKKIRLVRKYFFHPRVYIFVLIGTGIIFLTFLTDNNALEIAISGFASVFIGIGVNNFTALEMHQKDAQKINSKMGHSLKVMGLAAAKTEKIQNELTNGETEKVIVEFTELRELIHLTMQLLKEDSSLD